MKNTVLFIISLWCTTLCTTQDAVLVKISGTIEESKRVVTSNPSSKIAHRSIPCIEKADKSAQIPLSMYMAIAITGALTMFGIKPAYRSPITHSKN